MQVNVRKREKVSVIFRNVFKLNHKFTYLICVTLLAVICVYVASNQYYLLLKNSVFYGILKANGVSNREVFLMHMLCTTLIFLSSPIYP